MKYIQSKRNRSFLLSTLSVLIVIGGLFFFHAASADHDYIGGCNTNWGYYDCAPAEALFAAECSAAGGAFSSFYFEGICEGLSCVSPGYAYYCTFNHAPTCATNPTMDGCACSKANACNITSGTYSGGVCTAPEPAACPTCATNPTMDGCGCSITNGCNTTYGTYSGGSCNAAAPAACAAPTCATNPTMDGCSCSLSNGCNTTYGTYSGGSCNAAAPAACAAPTCATNPTMDGCACSLSNACNTTYGTYSGGSCNAAAPAACPTCATNPTMDGCACSRTNACNTNTTYGTYSGGSCSAAAPAACPAPLPPPSLSITADRLNVRKGETVRISWDANTSSAYNCIVYGPGFSPVPFNPSVDGETGERTPTINAKSEFVLECTDPVYGTRYTASTIVETTGTIEER